MGRFLPEAEPAKHPLSTTMEFGVTVRPQARRRPGHYGADSHGRFRIYAKVRIKTCSEVAGNARHQTRATTSHQTSQEYFSSRYARSNCSQKAESNCGVPHKLKKYFSLTICKHFFRARYFDSIFPAQPFQKRYRMEFDEKHQTIFHRHSVFLPNRYTSIFKHYSSFLFSSPSQMLESSRENRN